MLDRLHRMFSPGAAKRERHRQRVAAMHARTEAALAAKAAQLSISPLELKRSMAMVAVHAADAPARTRAQRLADIAAADDLAMSRTDAMLAEARAWREQQESERAAVKGSTVLFIDADAERRVRALQRAGKRVEAVRVIDQAVRDGVACIVPDGEPQAPAPDSEAKRERRTARRTDNVLQTPPAASAPEKTEAENIFADALRDMRNIDDELSSDSEPLTPEEEAEVEEILSGIHFRDF